MWSEFSVFFLQRKSTRHFKDLARTERGKNSQSENRILRIINCRSSHPEMFCKKGVLRNFAKFTGKHVCQNLFFKKVAGLSPAGLLQKRPWHRSFPVNLTKFLRTPFLQKSSGGCFCNWLNNLMKIICDKYFIYI